MSLMGQWLDGQCWGRWGEVGLARSAVAPFIGRDLQTAFAERLFDYALVTKKAAPIPLDRGHRLKFARKSSRHP
jgi:hypothetical protein